MAWALLESQRRDRKLVRPMDWLAVHMANIGKCMIGSRKEGSARAPHQKNPYQGEIHVARSSTSKMALVISVMTMSAVMILLVFGTYTRREKVEGSLVPEGGVAFIVARSSGAVERLLVNEGDRVKAGDPLAIITTDIKSEGVGYAGEAISSLVSEQISKAESRKISMALAANAKKEELISIERNIKEQIAGIEGLMNIKQEVLSKKDEELQANERLLSKGYVTPKRIDQLKIEILELESSRRQLKQRVLEFHGDLAKNKSAISQLSYQLSLDETSLDSQILELKKSQAQSKASSTVVLTALNDSIVSSVLIRPGQAVTIRQSLIALVPIEGVLEAELRIPNKSVGFLKLGQRFLIQYEAYPYQKFGLGVGHISAIAQNTTPSAEVSKPETSRESPDGYYKARARIDSQAIKVYESSVPLRPGMKFSADILLEKRSLLEWLLEPLYAWRMRSQIMGED